MQCVNCGTTLGAFNTTYPLWDGTEERFCSRCLEKYNKIKVKLVPAEDGDEFLSKNESILKSSGLTNKGIAYVIDYATLATKHQEEAKKAAEQQAQLEAEVAAEQEKTYALAKEKWSENEILFKETTGYSFEGYRIVEYLGIKSGEVVLGTGFLSEFSASIGDLFGAKSEKMANKFTVAKEAALRRLKKNCLSVNANAVIGVDLDISVMAANMIMACANGTAVRIEKI